MTHSDNGQTVAQPYGEVVCQHERRVKVRKYISMCVLIPDEGCSLTCLI